MFKNIFSKKKDKCLYAFADGVSVDLEDVQDEVFSQKMMGEGIAIKPSDNKIFSPCDGVIITIMKESKHAIGIRTSDGMEILIHVGLDTVHLGGEGFNLSCEEGQSVKKGQLLLTFDKELLKEKALDDITIMIIAELNNNVLIDFDVQKNVIAKESILLKYC